MNPPVTLRSAALFLSTLVCVLPAALLAAEPGRELTGEFRITGLFSPDRQQDLRDVMAEVSEFQLVSLDYDHARVTLRYDLQKLFPTFDPKKPPTATQIEQRLNDLLSRASMETFGLKAGPAVVNDKLTRLEIPVGILDCKGCRYAAYLAVIKVGGVDRATVDTDRRVTAWVDPAKADRAAVEAALKKANIEPAGKP